MSPARLMLFVAVFLAGILAAWLYTAPPRPMAASGVVQGTERPRISGNFTLLDVRAQPVQWTEINHRPQLVFFGFTHCPEACPTTLMNASRAVQDLATDLPGLRVTFISVDPARDTPEVLGKYIGNFGPAVTGYTGDEAGIAAAAGAFHVFYEILAPMDVAGDPSDESDYMVNHTSALFYIGEQDHILEIIPYGASPAQISEAVRRHL